MSNYPRRDWGASIIAPPKLTLRLDLSAELAPWNWLTLHADIDGAKREDWALNALKLLRDKDELLRAAKEGK